MMNRRTWLQQMSLSGLCLPVGVNSWAVRQTTPQPKRLIVIFLRGAIDGLSVVTPYREAAYYQMRGSIALAPPQQQHGVLDLDGQFGLHPALLMLLPYWQQKSMAFVHATGSTDGTRSHFDAQMFMETGKTGRQANEGDGWLNRLLTILREQSADQTALSAGKNLPKILQGQAPVTPFDLGKNARKKAVIDQASQARWFDQLYGQTGDVATAYQGARERRQQILSDLNSASGSQLPDMADEQKVANQGAPAPVGFALEASQIATILKKDAKIPLVFADLGDWDTHVEQGGATKGRLTRNLSALGHGLHVLIEQLGALYADTTIVVMSEFGRTLAQNGTGGTDHGHGNVMWLFGGAVQGGRVYSDWPGLDRQQLYAARDLAVTTDYRAVLQRILVHQWSLSDSAMSHVFPQPFQSGKLTAQLFRSKK